MDAPRRPLVGPGAGARAPPALEAESVSIGRWRRIGRRAAASLDSTAAVLIPFLAIYVSQDSFRLLFSEYAARVVEAGNSDVAVAILTGVGSTERGERLPWGGGLVLTTAAAAFVIRWLLRRTPTGVGLGLVGRRDRRWPRMSRSCGSCS